MYGRYIKDIVYGANDGIITTFAIIAGVAGAGIADPRAVIILLGAASVLADGFSMAASDYLGSKSEHDVVEHERKEEEHELSENPREEMAEMERVLVEQGYGAADAKELTALMFKKKHFFLDLMMHEERNVSIHDGTSPFKSAAATFMAFVGAGFLPILPFVVLPASAEFFWYSVAATALALFLVGALRSLFTKKKFVLSGLEMLFVGGVAAAIAYGVGSALSRFTGAL